MTLGFRENDSGSEIRFGFQSTGKIRFGKMVSCNKAATPPRPPPLLAQAEDAHRAASGGTTLGETGRELDE
jgi:hypothetical protein